MKSLTEKKPTKREKEFKVLLGLIELYLNEGKPIGSNTLKENGFDDVSSATIRNYFSHLEEEGYLLQQHSSGGRIPTDLAFSYYAENCLTERKKGQKQGLKDLDFQNKLKALSELDMNQVARYLQSAAELLSEWTSCAVFLASPRFDHDVVVSIKLVSIDRERIVCLLVTDFGLVHSEIVYIRQKLSSFSLKRIEDYLVCRIRAEKELTFLTKEEEEVAHKIYNEVMVRYIIGYANFSREDIYQTGFSRLLNYSEFSTAETLASGLSLFENTDHLRRLLRTAIEKKDLTYCIGRDLTPFAKDAKHCASLIIPYSIGNNIVGGAGLLGPMRMPYRYLFNVLNVFAHTIGQTLTQSIVTYKISYRNPEMGILCLEKEKQMILDQSKQMLLEDKRQQ